MVRPENQATVRKIVVISCAVFLVLLVFALVYGLINLSVASRRKAALERELREINAQIEANDAAIAYYQSDEYIEMIARKYLDMQGKGEISFVGK